MFKRFYVDTCIWRDLLEDRRSGFAPLGEFAFQFLNNCIKYNYFVYVSELVIWELEKYFEKSEIRLMFEPFLDIIVFVDFSREQNKEAFILAKQISGAHRSDIGHAIIARDNECVLITRDKHFDFLSESIKAMAPEEVSFQ